MPIKISAFAVGFVLYYPPDDFLQRLALVKDCVSEVYIFDNTPNSQFFRENLKTCDNIQYIVAGGNVGLGCAISTLTSTAYSRGHNFFLLFDQDTIFDYKSLRYIAETLDSSFSKEYSAMSFHNAGGSIKINTTLLAINSGCLFCLNALSVIGWHNHKYFVDNVDYEFCLRSKINNFKILSISSTPGFDHISLQDSKMYSIFKKKYRIKTYSASRIGDVSVSSIKLFAKSLSHFEFGFMKAIFVLYFKYLILQIVVRFVDSEKDV